MRKSSVVPVVAAMLGSISACHHADQRIWSPDVTVSVEGHHSSPWEVGPSVRMTYPLALGVGNTLNPMASYTYLSYDGGHENRFEVGAQVRHFLGSANTPANPWVGVEAAWAFLSDNYGVGSENYNGWSLSALAGVPIATSRLNPQIVGGAGITRYGSGGPTGKNVRIGVSVTPF